MPRDHTPRENIDSVLHLRAAPLHEPLFYGLRTAKGTEILLVTFMQTCTKNTKQNGALFITSLTLLFIRLAEFICTDAERRLAHHTVIVTV